jgi:hypothetical protein
MEEVSMTPSRDEGAGLPITKEALFRLIDLMVSASAHAGEGMRAAGEAWLNPQPLPPRTGVETPHPEPWRSAAVARQIISMAALHNAAAPDEETGLRLAQSMLSTFVDEFCATAASRRLPFPPPWPRSGTSPNAVDLLVAAAQFQAVGNALQGQRVGELLRQNADRLLQVGLQRLAG